MEKHLKNSGYILCPVCGEYLFTDRDDPKGEEDFCNVCGWHLDKEQAKDPGKKDGRNAMSLDEYKAWFAEKRRENPKFDYLESIQPPLVPHKCPVCGEYIFPDSLSHDICSVCGWEDDGSEDEPDVAQGANGVSLNEAKKIFAEKRKQDPKYRRYPKKR
jgi:ribosomal protein L32